MTVLARCVFVLALCACGPEERPPFNLPGLPHPRPAPPVEPPTPAPLPGTPAPPSEPPEPEGPVDVRPMRLELPGARRSLRPGEEVTLCRELRLDNPAVMLIRRMQVHITRGSHHVIVYRSRTTAEQPTPVPCQGFGGILDGTAPLFIAQQAETSLEFPPDTGLSINRRQMIRVEEHFVNTGAAPIEAGARVTFDLAPIERLSVAHMMFWGTRDIRVAPRSPGRASYFARTLPGVRVFGLTSHTHQFGVRATIERAAGLTGPGVELHRSERWEEPPLTRFDPPLTFREAEGLRLTCEYRNTSDQGLTFGESFHQEMCFLWAYYYPSQGFQVCVDEQCFLLQI